MKILFEIWGNYEDWKEVNYVYNEASNKNKTTLPLLYQEIKPDKFFIITSDTLINNLAKSSFRSPEESLDYKFLIEKVKEGVLNFADEMGLKIKKEDVMVIPGVGSFPNSEFKGNPNNFFYFLYYKIVKTIDELSDDLDANSKIEVYLDITHGINYTTVMTYRALKDIFSLIAFFYKDKVKFIALNSDPVVGIINNTINININEIENIDMVPQFNFYKSPEYALLRPFSRLKKDEKEKIGKNIKCSKSELIETCYAFAGSFSNALIPFIYYFYPGLKELENLISNTIEFFENNLSIENSSLDRMTIIQKVEIQPLFQFMLQVFLIAKFLLKKYNMQRKNELKLQELKKLLELYNFSKILKIRLSKELNKIETINNLETEYKDYGHYVLENYVPPKDNNIDDRNLYAHCGFAYTITQLKRSEEGILIKLKGDDENKIEEIKNMLKKHIIGA
jgi:CRISPR-associated protein Csx1